MLPSIQSMLTSWQGWALLSAIFAALTAVLAKLGVSDIHSDLATLVRTIVILGLTAGIVTAGGEWRAPGSIPGKTWIFLVLSGIATGLSWLCYFRALKLGPVSLVAPIDKLSVVFTAVIAVALLGEKLSFKASLGIVFIAIGAILTTLK